MSRQYLSKIDKNGTIPNKYNNNNKHFVKKYDSLQKHLDFLQKEFYTYNEDK